MAEDFSSIQSIAATTQATQSTEAAPKVKDKEKPSKVTDMEAELKQIELESAKLKLELDKANLVDMKERLAERELKRDQVRQDARTKGQTLLQSARIKKTQQDHCNHKKGGNGAQGVIGGQGDDAQYAVLKHTFANGDTWVRCLRCGKTWKPPVKSQHDTKESYDAAMTVYKEAVQFQTRNVPSKSTIFQFSDGGEYFREVTKDVSLA